jgi:hypothetical protein
MLKKLIKSKTIIFSIIGSVALAIAFVIYYINECKDTIDLDLAVRECRSEYFCHNAYQNNDLKLDIVHFNDSYTIYFDKTLEGGHFESKLDFINIRKKEYPEVVIINTTSNYIEFKLQDYFTEQPLTLAQAKISKIKLNVSSYF